MSAPAVVIKAVFSVLVVAQQPEAEPEVIYGASTVMDSMERCEMEQAIATARLSMYGRVFTHCDPLEIPPLTPKEEIKKKLESTPPKRGGRS